MDARASLLSPATSLHFAFKSRQFCPNFALKSTQSVSPFPDTNFQTQPYTIGYPWPFGH
jgi:hypothetical protein